MAQGRRQRLREGGLVWAGMWTMGIREVRGMREEEGRRGTGNQ